MPHDMYNQESTADLIRKAFPNKQDQLSDAIWLAELFDEQSKLIRALRADVDIASDELRSTTEELWQFRTRVFIRTSFAAIEGINAAFRQKLLGCHKVKLIKLDIKEFEKLIEDEESFEGQLIRPKRMPLKDVVKFLFTVHARKISKQEFLIMNDSNDWKVFCDSIKLRDRLMHPKSSSDLIVTKEEQLKLLAASSWYFGTSTEVLRLPSKIFE